MEARLRRGLIATAVAAWVAAVVAALTGAASLFHHDGLIEGGPSVWIAVPAFVLSWQLMLAAMMLPTSLPMIGLFARAAAKQPRPRAAVAGFLAGYVLVWTAFGGLAFLFDVGVHAAVNASGWLDSHQWILGAGVLALAGAFQFSSLKYACLDKCRHPVQFMTRFYERGPMGGLRLGVRHGVFCVGCCWALMLVMFSVGVASVVVMAALTGLMIHEKTQPGGRRLVPVAGASLLAMSLLVALAAL